MYKFEALLSTVVAVHLIQVLVCGHGSRCGILRESRQVWSAGSRAAVRRNLTLLSLVPHSLPFHLRICPRVETAQPKIAVLSWTTGGKQRFNCTPFHCIFRYCFNRTFSFFVPAGSVHEPWTLKYFYMLATEFGSFVILQPFVSQYISNWNPLNSTLCNIH